MTRARLLLKPAAANIFRSTAKNKIILSGRRFGKTMLMLTIALAKAIGQPGARVHYLGPSRKMARDIMWRTLKDQAPAGWVRSVMESQLTVEFNNGSIIILGGMDYADSLRGQASDCLQLDEFCYSNNLQESYEGALLPMLTTTNGDTVFASTPSGAGSFAQQLWERAADTPNWERWNYPSVAGGWVTEDWINQQKKLMDPVLFRQEFFGSWEQLVGAVFPAFGARNICKQVDMGTPILVGMDFNVNPLSAVIAQIQGNNLCILDELVLHDSDTRQMCQVLRTRYPTREITICPDPTGSRRQTSSMGLSDHAILRKLGGFKVASPNAPWKVRDKINSIRLMIVSAEGERRLQIDPKCKELVRALRAIEFEPGRSSYDKRSKFGHIIDATGYLTLAISKGLTPWTIGESGFRVA